MANLLPNGKQQFLDGNGKPLALGTVAFYVVATLTPKDTYQDQAASILNTNPVSLDANGEAVIFGNGNYRQIVKDAAGNTIWDQVTTDGLAGIQAPFWCGPAGGTANALTLSVVGGNNPTAYSAGQRFVFVATASNTLAVTAGVSPLLNLPVQKGSGQALVVNDIINAQYYELIVNNAVNAFILNALGSPLIVRATNLATSVFEAGSLFINGTLVTSVSASALTIAIKTLAGADPSATDPVYVAFRNATAATGDFTILTLTAATSFVVPAAATLGAVNSTAFRVWLVGFNDAGTFRLGVINCLSTSAGAGAGRNADSIYPLGGFGIASASTPAANAAQTFYANAAITSKAYTVLGHLTYETGLATAGTWSAGPTRLDLFRPGVPLPGQVIQSQRNATGAFNSGTNTIVDSDAIPQNTAGDQFMSQAITPSSAANVLEVDGQAELENQTSSITSMSALFQDATANALVAMRTINPGSTFNVSGPHRLTHALLAAGTVATTFKWRSGATGGTTNFNGSGGARKFGGVMNSYLSVKEIMA